MFIIHNYSSIILDRYFLENRLKSLFGMWLDFLSQLLFWCQFRKQKRHGTGNVQMQNILMLIQRQTSAELA